MLIKDNRSFYVKLEKETSKRLKKLEYDMWVIQTQLKPTKKNPPKMFIDAQRLYKERNNEKRGRNRNIGRTLSEE